MTPPGVTVIASVLALAAAAQAGQTGVVTPLFSSEDLGAWNREGADAEVQGPALLVREGPGWVRTGRTYGDFVLRFDARLMSRNGEAAVFVRAYPPANPRQSPPAVGYRIVLKEDRSAGRIVRHDLPGLDRPLPRGAAVPTFASPGAWHRYEIRCTDTDVRVTVDGHLVAELGGAENPAGFLAVQATRGDVEFRNIELETDGYRPAEVVKAAPASGVVGPRVIHQVKPAYAAAAYVRRIQGSVLLEGVVAPEGTLKDITVVKTLDSRFGLDHAAVQAAKQWRFAPGTRGGIPVPVLVTLELTFTLKAP
jgi:TonB family protein